MLLCSRGVPPRLRDGLLVPGLATPPRFGGMAAGVLR